MATPAAARAPLLLHVFPTFAVGGSQTRLVTLANALGPAYRHVIVAMDGNYEAARGFDATVEFRAERMEAGKSAGISLGNVRAARRILRRIAPDLLLTYNWGTIEWSLADWAQSLCPHIHVEDGFGPEEGVERQLLRRVLMRRYALSRCAGTIVPSETLFDLARRVWRLPPNRVLHVPNGVDVARFERPFDPALTQALPENAPVIGTVATLRAEKNLPRLVRAFAALPLSLGARLVIVGEGPERARIEEAAREAGAAQRIVLTGALADPGRIVGRFDIFALSSDTEQMPNSVLEAMAAGRAIVAPDVGDVRRMVAAGNQPFVVPRADERALTGALLALLQDPVRRQSIGRENGDLVRRRYSLEAMVGNWHAALARALAGGIAAAA